MPRPVVHGLRRYADVAIIGVLLTAVAVLLVRQSDLGPSGAKGMAIAVLPFENLVRAQTQAERRELERLRAAGLVPDRENDEQSEPAPTRAADVDVRAGWPGAAGVVAALRGTADRDPRPPHRSSAARPGREAVKLLANNSAADNLRNLFEIPVLFFAICLALYVTGFVTPLQESLAWGFGSRSISRARPELRSAYFDVELSSAKTAEARGRKP